MQEPLAIVGMSCRLPGADGLSAFWDLVSKGDVAWGPLPEAKLPRDLYFHPEKNQRGKSYSEMGSLVPDRRVDEANCPITDQMRYQYDEAHHLFLEVASLACRDAGLDPFAMPGGIRTGVYLGHTGGSTRMGDMIYATGIDQTAPIFSDLPDAVRVLGNDAADVADALTKEVRDRYPGRKPNEVFDTQALGGAKIVHEALKLEGPYLVVDAACASSLQALAIGARSLLAGGVDQAIVGGASYCKSDSLVLFSAAQSVSNNGSYPFGQEADGLITAEGYVALVVKTLSRAVADGDRIRAVIRGLGISSDGRGRSLWAPRSEGQVLAVERAYPDLKELAAVDYIEAHATSTQVGDATELGALASLVGRHIPSGHQIPIGSVKANIGHTLETAGLASLVKVVLAMEHGQIPPSSTCKTPNEDFDWQDGPFKLLSSISPWQRPTEGVRTAAVNAFGIGGLNVHVALREHQPTEKRPVVQATRPDPVAIVGAGCVMPDALDRDAFFSLLDSGRSAIGSVPPERWDAERAMHVSGPKTHHITSAQGGFVQGFEYDWRRHKVPPKQIAAANPLQFMLLEAADAALADSKLLEREFDRKRAAVIVGTLFGGEFADQLQMGLRLPETGRTLRRLLAERGVAAGDIDQIINAYEEKLLEKMPSLIDETGSFTSSTLASRLTKTFDLMGGALAFDAGKCSGVMAVQAALDMLRSGENDVVLCAAGDRYLDLTAFEDLSLVSQLATRPRSPHGTASGIIPGEGAVVLVLKRLSDAVAAGDPIRGVIRGAAMESARSPHEAMRNALNQVSEQAGVDPGFVGAVEFAGSGDPAQEQQLLEVLASTYASNPGDGKTAPACGSLDGVVGHCGSAAGAAGLLKMTHALSRGQMPVNVGSTPDSTGGHLQVSPQQPLPIPAADANGYRAATVTVVDGQQVGHLILDNGKPLPKGSHTSPVIRKASTADGRTGRVAALFPGQGSQYTDMFRELVAVAPEAKTAMDRMDQLSRQLGYETLSELAWRRDNALGVGIWETQWAMYLGDLFAWEVLRDMGLHVDVIASHSFGEFPSLAAAGAWTAEVGARAARCRGDAVEHVGPKDGALLSVLAPREKIEKILQSTSNQVFVCAENSADQVVVGGQRENVDAVESVLESQRMHFKRLAVPCPYHTPLLTASSSELSAGIGYLPIDAPQISVFSSTTAAPMLDSIGIRESLTRQMVETVQWVRVVERLYAEGVRTFVEVGPLGVLSGLVRRILKGKTDIHIIQFDQKSESAPEVMARLRAQLAEAGALQVKEESSNHEEILGDVMHHEDKQREKQTVVAFDATEKRRARNRAGGKGKEKVTPKTTDRSVAKPVTQKVQVEPQIASTVAAPSNGAGRRSANAAINGGNGHLPAGPAPASTESAMGGATGSRLRPTGEGDSLADILAAMYAEHGVAPPFAQSPAGSVERFWQALAEMFDLAAVDRQAVIEAADNAALERLLTGAGGKAEWLDAEPTHSTRQETPSVVASKPVSPTADPGQSVDPTADHSGADQSAVASDIETFLIDFVVEQTGYPEEIIELDVDLEADLGIDSIRKAQMMGEVGQKYGLEADASMSLDDFPTLRHLLDYIVPRVAGGEVSGVTGVSEVSEVSAVSEAPVSSAPPAPTASATDAAAINGNEAEMAAPLAPTADPVQSVDPTADQSGADQSALAAEIEAFLIDFVVEQTGYPEEIIELDVDLEADLGIDSIRKAQMMGEVGQKYGLEADTSMSLDDFPTLRHLLDYIVPRVAGGEVSGVTGVNDVSEVSAVSEAPVSSAPPATASATDAAAINGNEAEMAAPLAPTADPVQSVDPTADQSGADQSVMAAEIEAFLIDFVVEQTGYPEEIIELDVDLEADLGIDSIRKAQMMGEVGQKYGLEADTSMSLDDFPTLRHLLDYIVPKLSGDAEADAAMTDAPVDSEPSRAATDPLAGAGKPEHNGNHQANGHGAVVAEPVTSAAYQAGFEIGQTHSGAIRQWSRSVAQSSAGKSVQCVLDHRLEQQLEGIAKGAQVEVGLLRTAVSDPTLVVGTCDLLLDVPSASPQDKGRVSGFAMSFTRHIPMEHVPFSANDHSAGSGCLVKATGMPGAVVGWNDAGIVAMLGPDANEDQPLSSGMPAGQVVEYIARRCRSFDELQQSIDRGDLERPPAGVSVLVADLSRGGVREITPRGEIQDRGNRLVCRNRISPLTRILAGSVQEPSLGLAEVASNRSTAALSAACSWLAITIKGQHASVAAGSPAGPVQCGSDFNLPQAAQISGEPMPSEPLERLINPVTSRYVLDMRPIGSPQKARSLSGQRVLLLGNSTLSETLGRAVKSAGGQVEMAPCTSRTQAIEAVAAAEARGAVHHLVIVDRDPSAAHQPWPAKKEACVESVFFAVQHWLNLRESAEDLGVSSLTALVNLGGDFGHSGQIPQVEGGALCGLLKNLNREYPETFVRVVDAAAGVTGDPLCERFVAEMCDAAGPVEVGLLPQGRQVAAVTPLEVTDHQGSLPEALQRGSVWIVTGGARGVTAECGRRLAARYGVHLVLVGSTEPAEINPQWLALDEAGLKKLKGETMVAAKNRGEDPRRGWAAIEKSLEINRSLAALSEAGASACYEVCDLSSAGAVKSLVARVTQQFGPVRGLIHGAGYEASCRFAKKTPEGLAATLGPKCDGLAHLLDALKDAPLTQLVAFGSTSGRFGGHGQADYSAANDLLAKQVANARQRGGLAATVIHWHAWGGAGMANRPESRFVLEQFGLQFMPLAEGATRLLAELEAGLPHAEVVITEPKMCEGAIDWPEADRQAATENHLAAAQEEAPASGSLVAAIENQHSVTFELDPTQDCFLLEHKQLGRPLLPAVMGLELMSQAAIAAGQMDAVREIRNFAVSRPASFSSDNRRTFRVAMQSADNALAAELMAKHMRPDGRVADKEREHMRCELAAEYSAGDPVPLGDRLFPFNPMVYQEEVPMWHGPAFRTLHGLFMERSGGWGKLIAPDMNILAAPRGADGWTIPAALLDGCIVGAAVYSYIMLGMRVEVPMGFDRLRLHAMPEPQEECILRFLYRSHSESETSYDFALYGADERVLLSLDGLRLSVLVQGRI